MGADQFQTEVKKRDDWSDADAFNYAVEQAAWDYGHAGYTGTIAEKGSFTRIKLPDGVDADTFLTWINRFGWDSAQIPAEHLAAVKKAYDATDDKWGDAGCIDAGDRWIFFGWASA